jgi:hypothetical protein
VAIVACGLVLAGCGGDGGSDESSPSISFYELDSKFPTFPSVSANIISVKKIKNYSISESAFEAFRQSVLVPNYTSYGSGEYMREDISTGISYGAAYSNADDTLLVFMEGENLADFSILNDAVFDADFGGINGKLIQAIVSFEYDDDISSQYYTYTNSYNYLIGKDFDCYEDTIWYCGKESGEFMYIWANIDRYSYLYAAAVN